MFAVIGALALAAASTKSHHHTKAPEPVGASMQGLFTAEDYPAEALDKNQQGTVGIRVTVGADGLVSGCTVEKSSGAASLDERTCAVVRERAKKFVPPRDRHGKKIASEIHQKIVWRIADDDPEPSEAWASTVIMSYGPDGQPLSCRVELEGAKRDAAGASPPECKPIPLPAELRLLGRVTTLSSRQSFVPRAMTYSVPLLRDGDMLIGFVALDLHADEGGNITACTVVDSRAGWRGRDACAWIGKMSFTPVVGADGKPKAFTGTLSMSNSVHVERTAPAHSLTELRLPWSFATPSR